MKQLAEVHSPFGSYKIIVYMTQLAGIIKIIEILYSN